MGSTITIPKAQRKATFSSVNINGKRYFVPINKRAQALTRALQTNVLTIKDLRVIAATGTRPYRYNAEGKLRKVQL